MGRVTPCFENGKAGIAQMTGVGGLWRAPRDVFNHFEIPLPPLEVQRKLWGIRGR